MGFLGSYWFCFSPGDQFWAVRADDRAETVDLTYTATGSNTNAFSSGTNSVTKKYNGAPNTDSLTFTVHVGPRTSGGEGRDKPTFGFYGPPIFTVEAEDRTATAGVSFSYTAPEAEDYQGDAIAYSAALENGDPLPAWLSFAPASRAFSGTPGANDAPAVLKIEIKATDDAERPLSSTTTFTLTVERADGDTNQAPNFDANVGTTLAVAENSPAGTNVGSPITATDPDQGDTLTYSLSGTDAASFAIGSGTGQITTKSGVTYDYEDKSSYSLTVGASDGNGGTDSIAVTVNLTDVNEAPVFGEGEADDTGLMFTTRQVAENSPAGTNVGAPIDVTDPDADDTLTYLLTGTGATSFSIDSAGQITTVTGVDYDYETKSSYSIVVAVTDIGGLLNAIGVTVTLTDVDETTQQQQQSQSEPANQAPNFDANLDTTLEVAENSAAGTNVGSPITATDPDEGDTLTYSLSGTDAASFSIGSSTGQITTKTGVTYDYESSKKSYSLAVDVSDGKGGQISTPVTVNLTDVNEAPSFSEGASATREVAENSAAGTSVGAAVTATDPDAGNTLTYTLSGTDAASLDIGSSTGQLTTKTGVTYDYETKSSYSLTVEASDGNGGTASIAVTINLTDVATPVTACKTTIGTLSEVLEYAGAWNDAECKAHHQDSRARYFEFTLSADAEVIVSLSSGTLYVSKGTPANGWGTAPKGTYEHRREVRRNNGKLVHDGSANTATLNLLAGETYTVEAAGSASGKFTVNIGPQ